MNYIDNSILKVHKGLYFNHIIQHYNLNRMNILKSLLLFSLFVSIGTTSQAQTVDEIIDNYYEAVGGKDAWMAIEGIRYQAKINQGGMEIPFEMVQTKEGFAYQKASVQGKDFMQGVYDGEFLWNTNFMTQKAEKATTEDLENFKLNLNDFPDALLNYKANEYEAEYLGAETFDGTETHKIKLTKEQISVDGEKMDDVEFYFFEMESGALIGSQKEMLSGPMKGMITESKFSDYQEVEGLFMPFTMTQGIKDGQSQAIQMESIELNPEFDKAMLKFPTEAPATDDNK